MKKGKYLLVFVEEAVLNKNYFGYVAGRIEVWTQDENYNIGEIRFLTLRKNKSWWRFHKKYNGQWVNKATFIRIAKTIRKEFV